MRQLHRSWRLGSLVLLSAIALIADCANAQVVPDQTLGTENSTVRNEQIQGRDGVERDSDLIEGGARRGGNLFHSFGQFDVQEGRGAYFANPEGVSNILGRVTGSDRSEIFGTLGVLGSANLFLINPNGIVFGSNASLDLGGSFVGTTANAVQFGDQGLFSAVGSEIPQQLLTVNPSAFLFNSPLVTTSSITVQGNGQGIRTTTTPVDTQFGLRVPENQTLALIGGNLIFDGATIKTAGGRIELGSVGSGSVELVPVTDGWTFNYANVPAFQDIQLAQRAVIDASGLGGGNIQVRGNQITLSQESRIEASTLGSQPGGNLEVTATDTLNLNGLQTDDYYPAILAQTYSAGTGGNIYVRADNINFNGLAAIFAQAASTGAGGNIYAKADNISLNGQVRISTTTFGAGQGGEIAIQADRGVDIDGTGVSARIETDVDGEAGAQGGNLIITTPQLSVRSAQISSSVRSGNGQGGNLTVRASESVNLSGETPKSAGGSPGGLIVQVNTNTAGQGGDLRIETGRLSISDGSQAQAASFGDGDSGNIFISANRVEVLGTNTQNFDTGIIVGTGRDSRSTELPRGNSGDLTIKADQISVQGGGKISGNTEGAGNAGTILLQATDSIVLSGENLTNRNGNGSPGGVFAQVELGATGHGGNLQIETGRLSISDGSKVQVGTFSQGDAGNLFIQASEINVFNTGSPRYITGVFTGILQDPTSRAIPRGNGGNLTIQTDQLSIRNGAEVSANTSGIGNGGDLLIQAADRVEVVGTVVKSDGAERSSFLGAEVFPRGVNTPVSPEQITGRGGSLTVHTRELSIREGGSVSVSTFAAGDAGNILIQADELQVVNRSPRNTPSSLSANVGVEATGRGGTVNIETAQLNVRNGGRVSASTSGTGSAGSIRVQGANSVILDNGSISTAVNVGAAAEQPSNINLQTDHLSLTNGAQITASTSGRGNAGNITIRDANAVNLDRSTISSTVNARAIGNGGNITLRTDTLNLDRSNITASTQEQGRAGNITIRDANAINLDRSTISTAVQPGARGRGGNINLTSDTLNLDSARITARTAAPERAGNIIINASDSIASNNSTIETRSNNSSSGNVAIEAGTVQLQGNSDIRTQVNRGEGRGGNIALTADSVVAFDDSDIVTRAPEGQGGNITFNTPAFFGDGYQPDTPETESSNDRVDVDASGVQSGIVTTPDVSFIQNSLADLSDNATDPETLLANSCIVRNRQQGSFTVTGSGGLPERPGNASQSAYPTGTIQSVPESESRGDRPWQMGDAIVEPQGVYRLSDGRLVIGRECEA